MITVGAVRTVGPVGASRVRAREKAVGVRDRGSRGPDSEARSRAGAVGAWSPEHASTGITPVDIEITRGPAMNGLPKPFREVERAGLEPATPSLQSWCSPN